MGLKELLKPNHVSFSKRIVTAFSCITLILIVNTTSVFAQDAERTQVEEIPGRWSIEKAQAWYDKQPWLVGCNYIPANAINQMEMWQADSFDLKMMDRELTWAEDLGFNTLRVYLHDLVWGQDSEGLYQRMDKFLDLCDGHGMRVLFVFFDDCHCDDPVAGKQPPALKGVHNSGWAQSPGKDLVRRYHDGNATEEEKKRLQGYVQETMRRFKDDKRVLAWELYNEPGRSDGDKSVPLLLDAWKWAREVNPPQPICSTAEGSAGKIFIDIARANSDVISFHSYSIKTLEEGIQTYQQMGRPAMCTEYMARPGMPVQKAMPILKKHGVAAINWGFVSGKTGTVWSWKTKKGKDLHELRKHKENILQPGEAFPEPKFWFHDLYRVDGTPFSEEEIDLIKKMTGKRESAFSLFAFDNYMVAGDYTQSQVRADTLKEVGYDGMGTRGTNLVEQTEIFEKAGLKLFSTYLGLDLDADQKYDANLKKTIKQLKGKDTILWFTVRSEKYKPASTEGDAVAVEAIRELADAAYESGLKIALYPHANLYVETLADSVRIATQVNRRNVGGSFNLCHWLKVEGDIDYRPILKESLPYLFLVSISGAETGDTKKMGWDKLIQTLDKGSFDNYKFLKYLKEIGYTGPVGLQGYRIQGDPKENLSSSMSTWKSYQERYRQENQ